MSIRKYAIVSIALGVFSTAASANEWGGAQRINWGGFYIGAHAGHGWADWDGTLSTTAGCPGVCPDAGFTDGTRTISGEDFFGGGQIGFNLQSGPWVFGIEADISKGDIGGHGQFETDKYNPWIWDKGHDLSIDYFGTARLRLGYASGAVMPYVTGGLAWAKTEGTIAVAQSHDGAKAVIDGVSHAWADETHVGWTLGGGLEWAISGNWSLKAEYLYMDFGSRDYRFTGGTVFDQGVTPFDTDAFKSDLTMHTVRIGVNYKFGERAAPLK